MHCAPAVDAMTLIKQGATGKIRAMLETLPPAQLLSVAAIFIWTGFVRSGLGFGGAALGLPLMLFIIQDPIFWLPIIGLHLLFFSSLTLRTRLHDVDWHYLRHALLYILPPTLVGVFGLLTLPTLWLLIFIYSVTLLYAVLWLLNLDIQGKQGWVDKLLLITGGYVAGTSLTGAPLMVAVFARNVVKTQLRNTLFVLWFTLVSIKLSTFTVLSVDLQFISALWLLPLAAIGHYVGLRTHERIIANDRLFKQVIGGILIIISISGLANLY